MEEKDFIKKYWYNNSTMVTVLNPQPDDFEFKITIETGMDYEISKMRVEPRIYRIKAGGSEKWPGVIANLYLDQMMRLIAQQENRMDRMVDFTERAKIYDSLIVSVEDLLANFTELPHVAAASESQVVDVVPEEAFAGAKAKAK